MLVNMKFKRLLYSTILNIVFLRNKAICQNMDYALGGASLSLNDIKTGIPRILTIFNDNEFEIVTSLSWSSISPEVNSTNLLKWVSTLDGNKLSDGEISLDSSRQLPDHIDTGVASVSKSGKHTVSVTVSLDDNVVYAVEDYMSYNAGVAIIPLIVIIVLAMSLHMVEVSMGFGIFVGSCIVTGSIKAGFIDMLSKYILSALANEDHGYVYLFTFFLAGVVALMEKSGGLAGFANALKPYARTARSGQLLAFCAGLVIFFDDYANTLVVGSMFRSITDSLGVSCEKLAFLVDATAAPIASIVPISSWIGFEVGLIQAELDEIVKNNGGVAPEGFPTSGMDVFLKTIEYRYYPIFMLFMIPMLIIAGRDFGGMLVAERKVRVYGRTDGGDGSQEDGDFDDGANAPEEGAPKCWYNMVVPLVLLIFFIFYMLIATGSDGSANQSFTDKIGNANSYLGLLVATMATALCMLPFYYLQLIQDGKTLLPTPSVLKNMWQTYRQPSEEIDSYIKPLLNLHQFVESFILGMSRIFEALIVLTLAWAVGHVMTDVGANRLFALIIVDNGLNPSTLPTLAYIISSFMALATGTSWGTMTIMFPLITGPTFTASNGNLNIFYATIAGILSGAILGDHISPISDTTVLSSLASRCKLMNHVSTQAPYAMVPGIFAILWGTLPVSYGAYPNGVAIFLGFITMAAVVMLIGVEVINESGRFDIFTELYLMVNKTSPLHELKNDTKQAYTRIESGEHVSLGEIISNPKTWFSNVEEVESGKNLEKYEDDMSMI